MSTQTGVIREALRIGLSHTKHHHTYSEAIPGGDLERQQLADVALFSQALAALSELETQPPDLLMTVNDAQVSSSATPKEGEELVRAAQAVVDRWDTPLWKDVPHTGEFIGKLREALSPYTTKPIEP